jgi:hypothetical protein
MEVNTLRISSPLTAKNLFAQFGLLLNYLILGVAFGKCLLGRKTLAGAGEDCFRGLFYEVSLALVGVASPA